MFQIINIKKTFTLLLLALSSFCSFANLYSEVAHATEGRQQTFVVSAYYSPLPGQSRYLRGNYEAEIRLNGRGTNGADGTPVYVGMLAAPKSYPFGTKVEIPGLGIGTVHDRGGAIIEGAGYHRIDVWMGRGEEGLARALQWGMRTVEGTIYDANAVQENLSIGNVWANPSNIQKLAPRTARTMYFGSEGDDVQALQKNLKQLGFFDGPETGNFGEQTERAIFQFQRRMGIVVSEYEWGAGVFGPQTRAVLQKALATGMIQTPEDPLFTPLSLGTKGEEVQKVQSHLKQLGFFDGPETGNYGYMTQNAVFEFQKSQDILTERTDLGAGIFGPQTNSALTEVLSDAVESVHASAPETEKTQEDAELVFGDKLKANIFAELLEPEEIIVFGEEGTVVAMIQKELIHKGYLREGLNTGFYGERTQEAVMKLQQEHELVVNASVDWAGKFGAKTMKALFTDV